MTASSVVLNNAIALARIYALTHTCHTHTSYSAIWVTAEGKIVSMGVTSQTALDSLSVGCIWRAVWKLGVRIV